MKEILDCEVKISLIVLHGGCRGLSSLLTSQWLNYSISSHGLNREVSLGDLFIHLFFK